MKTDYIYVLRHVFHMHDIATLPNIDIRPSVDQKIYKLLILILEIENENKK